MLFNAHLCNHILLQSGCGTWVTALYTVRGVGSGSRDVDSWRVSLYTEDRGLQVPMTLEHGNIVGTQCCDTTVPPLVRSDCLFSMSCGVLGVQPKPKMTKKNSIFDGGLRWSKSMGSPRFIRVPHLVRPDCPGWGGVVLGGAGLGVGVGVGGSCRLNKSVLKYRLVVNIFYFQHLVTTRNRRHTILRDWRTRSPKT
jgi:hypothetical protein